MPYSEGNPATVATIKRSPVDDFAQTRPDHPGSDRRSPCVQRTVTFVSEDEMGQQNLKFDSVDRSHHKDSPQ